jgi:cysteine desulfurase/selenocysteine lyase
MTQDFWEKIREDFPSTKHSIYLDHAAGGPIAIPVKEEIQRQLIENSVEADFAWPKWMSRREQTRESVANFVDCDPEEVTFVHSTSEGMNHIADLISDKGDVLTSDSEFPSSTLPWIHRKNNITFQKTKNSKVCHAELQNLLSPKIKTILSSYVQYGTGYRQDMQSLGSFKEERFLVVNATQAFGCLPVSFKKWNADFLCANSYKWLMAGYGGGILVIKKKWLAEFKPAFVGWRSMKNADAMDNQKIELLESASRYELGCPSFLTIFAVGAAVNYLGKIGILRIEERILKLTDYLIRKLEESHFEILSCLEKKHRSGIVVFKIENAQIIWKQLLAKKIFVSPRGGGLRVAPHFYNSFQEIDVFIDTLNDIIASNKA